MHRAGAEPCPDALLRHPAAGPFPDAEAARLIAQATFGPTSDDIAHLRPVGYSAWLDEQVATTTNVRALVVTFATVIFP